MRLVNALPMVLLAAALARVWLIDHVDGHGRGDIRTSTLRECRPRRTQRRGDL